MTRTGQPWLTIVPPDGRLLRDRGTFELSVQFGELDLLRRLGTGSGEQPVLERYRLPIGAEWAALVAHYQQHLDPTWQREDVAERRRGFRLLIWRRDRRPGPARRRALALFDDQAVGAEDAEPFYPLVLASTDPADDAVR